MKRILAAVLVAFLLLCACGCKQKQQTAQPAEATIVGSWTTQIDMAETVNRMIRAQTGADTVSTGFPVIIQLTLSQDGTFALDFDRNQMSAQLDTLGTVLWQMVVDQAAAQSGITTQEAATALQEQGKNKELLMEQLDLTSMFENSICQTGVWKQENDKVYMAPTVEELTVAEGADLQFSGDQFSLTYTETPADEGQEPVKMVVTYTRVD